MFERFHGSALFFWSVEILLVATIIFVCTRISFIFSPIGTFVSTLFIPIVIAGFLFYLFNPLIKFLGRFRIKRSWAIMLVFLLFFGGLVLVILAVIPNLIKQITQLIQQLPALASEMEQFVRQEIHNPWLRKIDLQQYINQLNLSFGDILKSVLSSLTTSIGSVVGTITSVVITAITVPVMLFYMLRDGERLIPSIQRLLPQRYRAEATDLLVKMGNTISSYIAGQLIECLFVGTFTFLGYLLIQMPYGFLLGFIAGICNIIPYVGPYIGIAPALLIAITVSPMKAILVIVVVIVVQQVDGNLIYPNVIGRTLAIHPLTIIILLLVAGNLAGIMGMIFAIPVYAIAKTIVTYFWNIYQLRQKEAAPLPMPTAPEASDKESKN